MEIAFFGSSLVSSYWNGAATYYRGLLRNVAERGHRITFYGPDAFDRQQHRDIDDPSWARVVVYATDHDAVYACLEHARNADLVIKASGVGVFDELLEREVLRLASSRTQVAFWDVDPPATLERIAVTPEDPFRELIPAYAAIFTYGGGARVVERYHALGAQRCVPIYNALDPTTHYRVAPDTRFSAILGLLANRLPDREARIREFFFKPAALRDRDWFLLGGNGWDQGAPMITNVRTLGHVPTADHNAFNSSPLAVLNVNRDSMARFGSSPPTRIFESAGAAACIITDRWDGIEEFLEPDREILCADDGDHVVDILNELTPARARAIGEAALRRVTAHHTYAHRAAQFEAVAETLAGNVGRDSGTACGVARASVTQPSVVQPSVVPEGVGHAEVTTPSVGHLRCGS